MATLPQQERPAGELSREVAQMDDFEVIREHRDVMAALATLTDRDRALNHEICTRETLKWMMTPRHA